MIASDDPDLRRLSIRSWRRGIKEMDLILGPWFDRNGAALSADDLAAFSRLLEENDQDLYAWVSGRESAPADHAALIENIVADHMAHTTLSIRD